MAGTRNTDHGKGICRVCREEKSLTANLRIRSHKINKVSCDGGSDLPYDPAQDTAAGPDILADSTPAVDDPFGDADDTPFDPTDASTEVDDRPTLFDVRNARKVIDSALDKTSTVPPEIVNEAEKTLIRWENEGVRGTSTMLPEMGQTEESADHVHDFVYYDGHEEQGRSGSFCRCGVERVAIPAKPAHGGPNPHRAPLPTVATYDDGRTPEQQAEIDRRRENPRDHLLYETLKAAGPVTVQHIPDFTPETLGSVMDAFMNGSAKPAAQDDVNVFMGSSAKASAGTAADVNDFMSGDEQEEENTPRYFPARYDGNCDSCGADFGEGENIRADGSGGWEAEECCGDAAPAVGPVDRPKVVYPKLPVVNGRYSAPHPETGEKAKWTRVTNFNKKASDHFALEQWGNRCLAVGLAKRPDLLKKVQDKDVKADRDFLNKLAEEAKQAAGSKERARLGTIMHKHTEQVDAGHKTLADVPEQFRNDVAVYQAKMKAKGLMMVPHLMERSTAVVDLQVAGTFDGIARLPDGTYMVADKKTGATLEYNQYEIAVQLAVYARGINTSGIAVAVPSNEEGKPSTWAWEKPQDEDGNVIKVREDFGIVIHLPYGTGDCFISYVPLDVGQDGMELCRRIQQVQKIKHIITEVPDAQPSGIVAELEKATAGAGTVVDAITDRGFIPPTAANAGKRVSAVDWMERFAAITSKFQALELYNQAKDAGLSTVALKALVEVGKGALNALAAKPEPPAPVAPAEQPWERLFADVRDKDMARGLYGRAKAAGLPSGRLVELAEIGRAALKKLQEPAAPPEPTWEDRFETVTTKDQARELYQEAKDQVSSERLVRLVQIGKTALEEYAAAKTPAAPELTWEDRFMLITSKDQARELYQEVKDQVSSERLSALVTLGKLALAQNTPTATPAAPEMAQEPTGRTVTLEDRFKAVKTKEEARELYQKARDNVATIGMTRLNSLVKLAQEALSFHEEPPF